MSTYVAIGLISAATLLLEISFLRLFAVQQFYHFAFMAVSLALLGAGASGSILSVRRRQWPPYVLCLAYGLAVIAAYLVINYLPFDSFSIAWDGRQLLYLAIYFLAAAVPFLFAGLLVGGELIKAGGNGNSRSHQVYSANLIGSAIGSLLSLLVLAKVGGEGAVIVSASLGFVSGLLLPGEYGWTQALLTKRLTGIALIILLLISISVLASPPRWWSQRISPYKTLSILEQTLDAEHTISAADSTTRIDVIESSTIHSLPGLSLFSPLGPPTQAGLMLDGDNLMPITSLSPDSVEAGLLADHLPLGLAYRIHPQADTLVLEAGTGMDVMWALASGAPTVTAVEENRLVIDTVREAYDDFTHGLLSDPRVEIINHASRVYSRQAESPAFDVVVLSLSAPHRPVTSGAYSLTEDYSLTVEAMEDYLNLLDHQGVFLATRWLQTPPSESGRLFGMLVQALTRRDLDPADHLIAFRTLRTMTILATLEPLDDRTINLTRQFLEERGFDGVHYPGILPRDLNRFNILEEPAYYQLFQDILRDPQKSYRTYRYDLRPSSDDHPFFHHYFRWRQTPEILATLGKTWQPFGGSGFFVLIVLLILVMLAAAVFIMGPLLIWRRTEAVVPTRVPYLRLRVFLYFACLGLAYLFVEIPLAQRFILTLGQPVTALAIVLFVLLLSSGLGSLTVRRWSLRRALLILVILVALYPVLLATITPFTLRWAEGGRMLYTVLILAPLGYFMGLPFAGGLHIVEQQDKSLVPWSWAINGSFSVISSVLAVMAALTWGFSVVVWLGALAYAGALLMFGPLVPGRNA